MASGSTAWTLGNTISCFFIGCSASVIPASMLMRVRKRKFRSVCDEALRRKREAFRRDKREISDAYVRGELRKMFIKYDVPLPREYDSANIAHREDNSANKANREDNSANIAQGGRWWSKLAILILFANIVNGER